MSNSNNNGKIIVFSAPSGAGKTTIVKHLMAKNLGLEFSISACNRQPRNNEQHGKDYYFLTTDDFKNKIQNSEFIEWEEVYTNQFYGTLKSELERIWGKNNCAVFDIDVKGGINIKQQFGNKVLSVFVMPPSVDELQKRLENRNTDSAEQIKKRIEKAQEEISYSKQFDYILINDNLEKAKLEAEGKLREFLNM